MSQDETELLSASQCACWSVYCEVKMTQIDVTVVNIQETVLWNSLKVFPQQYDRPSV